MVQEELSSLSSSSSVERVTLVNRAMVVAMHAMTGAIGYQNKLPWSKLKGDFQFLKWATTGQWQIISDVDDNNNNKSKYKMKRSIMPEENNTLPIILMGRKTWESIGRKSLPLRRNIVVSTTLQGSHVVSDLEVLSNESPIYVLGGAQLYQEAFNNSKFGCQCCFVTFISSSSTGNDNEDHHLLYDTVFPLYHLNDKPCVDITEYASKELGLDNLLINNENEDMPYVQEGSWKYQFKVYFLSLNGCI